MSTPLSRSKPPWLYRQKEEDLKNRHYRRSHRYYRHLYRAWPAWADPGRVGAIYRECRRRRKNGENVHVDHIVPVVHPHVSGLHCPDNLRIVGAHHNLSKGNRVWPGMWEEQISLDLAEPEPRQLQLFEQEVKHSQTS